MQWQHGSYEKLANGSLTLTPIKVDGRQLFSDPCQYKNAVYTRYNATEHFKVRPPSPTSPPVSRGFMLTGDCSNTPSLWTPTTTLHASTSTNKTAPPSCPCTSPTRPRKCCPPAPSTPSLPRHPPQEAKSSAANFRACTMCCSSAATGARTTGGGSACS
jgi:hypothetical protein